MRRRNGTGTRLNGRHYWASKVARRDCRMHASRWRWRLGVRVKSRRAAVVGVVVQGLCSQAERRKRRVEPARSKCTHGQGVQSQGTPSSVGCAPRAARRDGHEVAAFRCRQKERVCKREVALLPAARPVRPAQNNMMHAHALTQRCMSKEQTNKRQKGWAVGAKFLTV